MSRIYSNDPLTSLPVHTVTWSATWDPKAYQKGGGVILEGRINARSRHSVQCQKNKSAARYYVLHMKISKAHHRQYDASGKEVEPNFSATGKVRTGFLNSSYKTEAKGESDALSQAEAVSLLSHSDLVKVTEKSNLPDCIAMWVEEAELSKIELEDGDELRVKTRGNSSFVETLTKLDTERSTVQNYAGGEAVGGSWTDKVMAVKSQGDDKPLPGQQNEGVDDDEWDD